MKYRRLGRTNCMVSEIGMGGMGPTQAYGKVGDEEFVRGVRRGLEVGINFIDTAPAYRRSEEVYGVALKGLRDKVFITTKVGCWADTPIDYSKETILKKFPDSLRRLQTDYVDLVLIHDIQHWGLEKILASGAIDALRRLRDEGKIRYVGVSGRVAELMEAVKTDEFDAILTFNTYNLLRQEAGRALMPLAKKHDVGVILGGPFYQGLLAVDLDQALGERSGGRGFKMFWDWDPAQKNPGLVLEKLSKVKALIKELYGTDDMKTVRKINLAFILTSPDISTVISGVRTLEEVEENASISDGFTLPSEIIKRFKEIQPLL